MNMFNSKRAEYFFSLFKNIIDKIFSKHGHDIISRLFNRSEGGLSVQSVATQCKCVRTVHAAESCFTSRRRRRKRQRH